MTEGGTPQVAGRRAAGRWTLLSLLVVAVVLAAASAALAAPLLPATAPGFARAKGGIAAERSALAAGLPAASRRALAGTRAEGAVFRAGPVRLSLSGFVLDREQQAVAVLAAWRAHGGSPFPRIGDEAASRVVTGKGSTSVTIVVRVGRAVGQVRYRTPGRDDATARRVASLYSEELAVTLRAALSVTPWDGLVAAALADGTVSRAEALRAFAYAYGAVPGVARPTVEEGPAGGSLAIQLVSRHLDGLTAPQRAAVRAATDEALADATARSLAASTPDPALQQQGTSYLLTYLGLIAPDAALAVPIRVYRSKGRPGARVSADAVPVDASGALLTSGQMAACRIRLFPRALSEGAAKRDALLAIEVFRCIEYALLGERWNQLAPWIGEGAAYWAATAILPDQAREVAGPPYLVYLESPGTPLLLRAADAVGFFGALQQVSGDLWPRLAAVVTAPDSDTAFAAAGGTLPAFLAQWASLLVRENPARTAWFQTTPFVVEAPSWPSPRSPITGNGSIAAAPHANALAGVAIPAARPFATLQVSGGPARLDDGVDDRVLEAGTYSLCLRGACTCPPGQRETFPPYDPVDVVFYLALTGGVDGSKASLAVRPAKDFCEPDDEPFGGPAESSGDPHLTTFDGLHLDFQAVGEFVLARSPDRAFEIQTRQSNRRPGERKPFPTTYSVNVAVAMRVGGARLVFGFDGTTPTVRLDGAPLALTDGASLPVGAGGSVTMSGPSVEGGVFVVRWPDGSQATVFQHARWAWSVVVDALAPALRGTLVGLLGNADGNPVDDLRTRQGKVMPIVLTPGASSVNDWVDAGASLSRAELYDRYGESWRITQKESLLDYRPGETTATFTDRSLPTKPERDEVEARRAAREACVAAGIVDERALADCVFDVLATDSEDFAAFAALLEQRRLAWQGTEALGDPEELSVVAGDGGGHVVASVRQADGTRALLASAIGPDGAFGAPLPVASGLQGSALPAVARAADGSLRLAYGTGDANANTVVQSATAPSVAGGWSAPSLLWQLGFGHQFVDLDVEPDGRAWSVFTWDGGIAVGRGSGPAPATASVLPGTTCSVGNVTLAATGIAVEPAGAWVSWQQELAACPPVGAQVSPVELASGAVGAPLAVPQACPISLPERGATIAGRPQGGAFVVYWAPVAGASCETGPLRLLVWRVGSSAPLEVPGSSGERTFSVGEPAIGADPATGAIWVAWHDRRDTIARLRLSVSDPAATGFPAAPTQLDPPVALSARQRNTGRWRVAAHAGRVLVVFHAPADPSVAKQGSLWAAWADG